jgi:hypothetical protein
MFRQFARLGPIARYGVIAIAAFLLGSGTVTAAAAIGMGSLFSVSSVNGVPTTPCSSANGAVTCFAVVDQSGRLSVSDADTKNALHQLNFDSAGNLKVSTGTAAVALPVISSIVFSAGSFSLSTNPAFWLTGMFTGAPFGTVTDSFGTTYTVTSGAALYVTPSGPNHGPGIDRFVLTVSNPAGFVTSSFSINVTA